jgi:hypothetical protein
MQRDAKYEAVVQMLLDREVEDRHARAKRQLGYRQHLESVSGLGNGSAVAGSPTRLFKFRTKVPCRATPEARALLDQLKHQFPDGTVTFLQVTSRHQAVMLSKGIGTQPKQIGWIEHSVQTDAKLCNVRDQGLALETNGGTMLVFRFRYAPTAVRMSSPAPAPQDEVVWIDFTEIRPALDLKPFDEGSTPPLVWVTRPEVETMDALGSRDYDAFYVRFKLEVQAGIWHQLSSLLSNSPGSHWHRGSYYTVVREPEATNGRISQRTVDDSGNAVDIGLDRIYDASAATDILLLYLGGDILADFADIYFTLQSVSSADAYPLKEEFFALIRAFWGNTQSLAWEYDSELAAVVRMSQRAVPTPSQALVLQQDWTALRQSLIDRYQGGREPTDLIPPDVAYRPADAPVAWPFATFPAGEVNIGLRLVYRQEWRGDTSGTANEVLYEAAHATVKAMKWPVDVEGSINTGVRGLAATTDMGLESECRESSRDMCARLTDIMQKMSADNRFAVRTRPAEIQNVVLVAEKLPTPSEIDVSWVKRHDWILAQVLLDESFRDALNSIRQEARPEENVEQVETFSGTATVHADGIDMAGEWKRGYRDPVEEQLERRQRDLEVDAARDRLYEHLRANILHYQRAIWQQEDPQQRCMRYRKSGKKVPLDWRFEIETGGPLHIDELCDRLSEPNVDAQFTAYSSGREADLDQVIDPTGPVGYHANYAIYHMRPEFGSEDLFSMLHFFKSPYLQPNPETGEPQVTDPLITLTAEQPVVTDVADVLDTETVVTTSAANDLAEAPSGYELLLGNARESELVLANAHQGSDWSIRSSDEGRVPTVRVVGGADPSHGPESQRLTLVADVGLKLASMIDAPATPLREPMIIACGDEDQTPCLIVSAAAASPHDMEAERLIVVHAEQTTALIAGVKPAMPHHAVDARVIIPPRESETLPNLLAGAVIARIQKRPIVGRDEQRLRPNLVAG